MRRGSKRRAAIRVTGCAVAGGGGEAGGAGGAPTSSPRAAAASRSQATNASSRLSAPRAATSSAGAALTRTRPACMSEIRSQRAASFMKWVETKIVTPSSRDSSTRARQKASRASGSTPDVGSSRIKSSGPWIVVTASDSRWRTPSGSVAGSASRTPVSSKRSAMARARASTWSGGRSNRRACRTRFCRTVSSG